VEEVEEDLKEGGLNILEKGKEAVQEKVEAVKEKIEETFRGPSHGRGH
jgi:chaperonin cofactor prefoldin